MRRATMTLANGRLARRALLRESGYELVNVAFLQGSARSAAYDEFHAALKRRDLSSKRRPEVGAVFAHLLKLLVALLKHPAPGT